MPVEPLPSASLCRRSDPSRFGFETTADLAPLDGSFGQERAAEAIRFGVSMRREGYHVCVIGPPGAGKHALVRRLLSERARSEAVPDDWCYLNDFKTPQRPRAVRLPAGEGAPLKRAMEGLVEELRAAVPSAFESEEYRTRLQVFQKQAEEERDRAMSALQQKAAGRGIAVLRTPVGLALAPLREGEVLDPEKFHKLPEAEQERIQKDIAELQEELAGVIRSFPALERAHREKVKEMNREVALFAVEHLIDELRKKYEAHPPVLEHLDAVQKDVVENVHEFLGSTDGGEDSPAGQVRRLFSETPAFRRYAVNVIVDRSGQVGAPVVEEDLPTHAGLLGRIEHHAHFGTLVTDFTLLRAGALHRANGGYLVVDVRKVLMQPFAWDGLKRALRSRLLRIEPPERMLGLSGAASLEPEPIPLDVKVVLVADRLLHYLLCELDPDFMETFKVAADFEDEVPRGDGGEERLARLVAGVARDEKLRPLDRGAMARLVEHAARLAGDTERLTGRVGDAVDLVRESDQMAAQAGRAVVTAADVQTALDGQERRADRLRQRVQEEIRRGTILIDTGGSVVGQVNGLSVHQVGRFAFGRPSRITARVRLGRGEVVDIEREVELGGPLHSKGVLILSAFLGSRYASDRPFTLSASLVFEQSYGGVEGDSASSAELYALLSALSALPIRQGVAVTGSVNQHGQVQPIGGVNEKIEGFFDVCRARGLTGAQGVIIPASNAKHLMLRREVVEAAEKGLFRVWPVENVDQGIELLTGVPAGERGPEGRFPEGSVNGRVAERLETLAKAARAFAVPEKDAPR